MMKQKSQDSDLLLIGCEVDHVKERRHSYRVHFVVVSIFLLLFVVIVGCAVSFVAKDVFDSEAKPTQESGWKNSKPLFFGKEKLRVREDPWKNVRLPRDVIPIHYDIQIYPNFYDDGSRFNGTEAIQLSVQTPTRYIILHVQTDYVNITKTELVDEISGETIPIEAQFYYVQNHFFVMQTLEIITADRILAKFQFEGTLIKSLQGLYKSSYVDTRTHERNYLVSTQFEPTYARRAFPCFDEPNMKAQFTVTLMHKPEFFALSNMPTEDTPLSVDWSEDLVATKFKRSVTMSTYLLCLVVCNFEYVSTTSDSGIKIKVYTSPDKIDQAHYALDMAKHSLETFEKLFKIPYPLPKQDLIGIPDFASGAMENWGLITFRESLLLYDPDKTPLSNMERVSAVVCHEMAHQWFGNLVTMNWWNDLWLNEGFASFMQYTCVSSRWPDWDYYNEFLLDDTLDVMIDDALNSTHPIVVPVQNPDEISSAFDAISYSKGASVIRMLETVMGPTKFFKGISAYLERFAYGNAATDDLWEFLTQASDPPINVKEIMDTWTIQGGYPFINVSLTTSAEGMTTVRATQKRFMSDRTAAYDPGESPFGYKWYVFLDYIITDGGMGSREIPKENDIVFTGDFNLAKRETNWLKFNIDKTGFYRVLYPDDMWQRFTTYFMTTPSKEWALNVGDRSDLLADAFSFAESDFISYYIPLNLVSYLSGETQYVPWSVAVNYGMSYINDMLVDTADYELWKDFLVELVGPVMSRLGYQDVGTYVERRLRTLILGQACGYEDSATLTEVENMFRDWLDTGKSPSVNLRSTVYACGMAEFGTDADWGQVWEKYQAESSPQEKGLLIFALSRTKRPYLLANLLDRAKRQDGIKTQDFFTVVNYVGNNIYGRSLTWDWTRENYKEFEERFTVNDRSFGQMVYRLVKNFNTAVLHAEVQEFFQKYPNEGASARYREMALEDIDENILWMETARHDVVRWLKLRGKL